jgi:hypothetical protein
MLHDFTAIFTYLCQDVEEVVALKFRSNQADLMETLSGALNHAVTGTYLENFEFEFVGVYRTGSDFDEMYNGHVDLELHTVTYVHRKEPVHNTIKHVGDNVYRYIMNRDTRNHLKDIFDDKSKKWPKIQACKLIRYSETKRNNATIKVPITACKVIVESFMLNPTAYEYRFSEDNLL